MSQQYIIGDYTFNAAAKTITISNVANIRIEGFQIITNITTGVMIYQFNNPSLNGSLAGNVLNLTFNTTSMSNTDKLQILYIPMINGAFQNEQEGLAEVNNTNILLRRIVKLLESSGNVDFGNRQRVVIDNILVGLTLTAITTVSTVTNTSQIAGLDQRQFNDMSRISYSEGIRRNLIFS